MKYSTKVSDAVHILSYIALSGSERLKSDDIAYSVKTNPGCVRQLMAKLKKAGIIESTKGKARPALKRSAKDITILDIYRAVEDENNLLHLDTHINPECGIGVNIQLSLKEFYQRVQRAAESEMALITLSDILERYSEMIKEKGIIQS